MNTTAALDIIRDVVNNSGLAPDSRARVIEAWGVVETQATPRSTTSAIKVELETMEQTLAEMVVDAQDAAEERGEFTRGMFTGDNDDIPICVPEDAAPYLDAARSCVREAIESLEEELA